MDIRLTLIKATEELIRTKKELTAAKTRISELEWEKAKARATIIDIPLVYPGGYS